MRYLWRASVLWSLVLLLACEREPRGIVVGALPARPGPAPEPEDAGAEIPDGAVLCRSDETCDDAVPCTRDQCVRAGYCVSFPRHELCSDDLFCTGTERCERVIGCVPVVAPRCDDGDACTIDRCDEAQKACVHGVRDFDRDGEIDVHCAGGTDCDDFDETRGTRILEVCENRIDDDCDDAVDEAKCGRAMHDRCDDALEIGAGGRFVASLDGSVGDYVFVCDEDSSRDVVFTFALTKPTDVTLVASGVRGDGSEEIATLSLQRTCGELGSEVECRRGFPSELAARALPAGRYYVLASSYAARLILLRADFADATAAPTNTRCGAAIDASAGGRFVGDFVDVSDTRDACGWPGGADLYYAVTLQAPADVELAAQTADGSPLALEVVSGCGSSAASRLCDATPPTRSRLHQLPKGRHIVVVSGPPSREVAFTLDVAILPPTPEPPGDTCDHPLAIELGEKLQVLLADKQDDVQASCQRFGADAVLSLRVARTMDLAVDLDSGDALAVFALQRGCGEANTELACRAGAPLSTRIRNVSPGDYFLVIEAPAAAVATLQVTKLPASEPIVVAGNGACETAFELPTAGGLFVGDTRGELDDYAATCGSGAHSSDVAYRLVLSEAKHVVLRADAEFDSVLYRLREDASGDRACDDSQAIACDDDSGPGAQAEIDEQLDPGTYYYVLDGFGEDSAGRYQLELDITEP